MVHRDGISIGNIRDLFSKTSAGYANFKKKSPVITPNMKYPKDNHLYDMIYYPPISNDRFNELNIHGPCKELSNLMATICKMSSYQLYQIPAVKQHFGDEFIHGFTAKVNTSNAVEFLNLDNTLVAAHFTKEMAYIVERVIKPLLDQYNLYLYYGGNYIEIFDEPHYNHIKRRVVTEDRLFWDK